MKQAKLVMLTIFILMLAGCNGDQALLSEQQHELEKLNKKIIELEATIKKQQDIIEQYGKEFSYLQHFTEGELEAYERFMEDKDVQHLADYSPENIVLLYFHSVVIDDVETIYSLTYNDGTLPDLTTFRQKYYTGGLHRGDLETTLDFRYYDSIEVRDDHNTDNGTAVEMKVNYGFYHPTVLLGLKQQEGLWKMDLLHQL